MLLALSTLIPMSIQPVRWILDLLDEPNRDGAEFKEPFMASDSPAGVVRHATLIEWKHCCVLVTRDNVQTLLQSIQQTKLQRLCRLVLAHMGKP